MGAERRTFDWDATWRKRAACLDLDPELFFPVSWAKTHETTMAEGKAICAVCPVRRQCLDFAIDTHQEYGLWGGMDAQERRRERRRRTAQAPK